MKNTQGNTPKKFHVSDIDWKELTGIGIPREELESSGQLEVLLQGGKTDVMSLNLVLLGAPISMDARLQLAYGDDGVQIEIMGVKPEEEV